MDIISFQTLFSQFQHQLKSYLYRLLADRNDAYDKIESFNQESSLKTWVFKIATHLAYDLLRRRKRWMVDAQDVARQFVQDNPDISRLAG